MMKKWRKMWKKMLTERKRILEMKEERRANYIIDSSFFFLFLAFFNERRAKKIGKKTMLKLKTEKKTMSKMKKKNRYTTLLASASPSLPPDERWEKGIEMEKKGL
jgi:activator of 2-hydroxyglutaryl-CoA dehydratase